MNILDPLNIIDSIKKGTNQPPGSLIYTGIYKDQKVIIDCITYDESYFDRKELPHFSALDESDNKIQWLNVTGLHDIEQIKLIGDLFDIHMMDLEDIVHVSQRSKIEERNKYLFSIFKMVYLKNEKIVHEHVSIIISDNRIITFQETPGDVFDSIRDRISNNIGQIRVKDIDYLYYSIIDSLVDQYFEILNYISEKFNDVEMKIIEENYQNIDEIYSLRKELLYLKNAILPIKDALTDFIKINNNYFDKTVKPYYEDVIDHLHQIFDTLTIYREMVNSLYEMQMSNSSNEMNKTMMTLTIFSAIFIPLSFLAGVFGMNFKYMPGLDFKYSFLYFSGGCFSISIALVYYFKRKR